MSEETKNENWSEWLDWKETDIYSTIYDVVQAAKAGRMLCFRMICLFRDVSFIVMSS